MLRIKSLIGFWNDLIGYEVTSHVLLFFGISAQWYTSADSLCSHYFPSVVTRYNHGSILVWNL